MVLTQFVLDQRKRGAVGSPIRGPVSVDNPIGNVIAQRGLLTRRATTDGAHDDDKSNFGR